MDYNKIALKEAAKSKCNKRKVGAVIVNAKGDVIAKGHNHFIAHTHNAPIEECEDKNSDTRPEVVHAEVAAINKVKDRKMLVECTIYVTHQPCENCQKAIDEAGLTLKLVTQFMKFDSGKLRYNLVPPAAMKELAKVLTYGAKKYKANNWQEVDDTERYIDALYRHLEAWRAGEKVDEESGLSHLSHALTNVAFLIHFEDIDK